MSEKIKVLLVDDEPDMLDIFKDGLEDLSFDVTCAQNVQAAQNFLHSNTFQCLITDIAMPGQTGVDLVAGLRAEGNNIPVFFITGYLDYSREKLNALKPKAVIFKPFDIEEAALLIKNHFLRQS
jgi:DNA-binding response OmpR family regulator